MMSHPLLIVAVIVVMYLVGSIKILAEYERGVIFRLGKLLPAAEGARASSSCSRPSIAWCGSACARSSWTCRRRTSSRATTCR